MVFCRGARTAQALHAVLSAALPSQHFGLLHGEVPPDARDDALRAFQEEAVGVLLCTDVAARGLDFPRVRHVIMYDFPKDAPTFIHRAGRTARRGAGGLLTCFVAHADMPLYRQIRQGEAQPGSALQQSAGRLGAAPERRRRPPPRKKLASRTGS